MGISDMKDMFSQLKQAQKQVKLIQKELSNLRVESEAGGGLVKATVDGEATLVDLEIDESMLQGDELKVLPKLIRNAVQDAQKKAREQSASQMQSMAGGMGFPGM